MEGFSNGMTIVMAETLISGSPTKLGSTAQKSGKSTFSKKSGPVNQMETLSAEG